MSLRARTPYFRPARQQRTSVAAMRTGYRKAGIDAMRKGALQASAKRKARLQAQRLLKGRHAATGNRDLLVYAVERKK